MFLIELIKIGNVIFIVLSPEEASRLIGISSGSKNAGKFLTSRRNQLAFQEGLCSMEKVSM